MALMQQNSGNDQSIWTGVSNSTCAPPACLDPYGLSASNGTSSSIDVSWTGGPNATSYTVEYGITGFTQGSGTTTTSSTTSATVTGLTSYTVYDFAYKQTAELMELVAGLVQYLSVLVLAELLF